MKKTEFETFVIETVQPCLDEGETAEFFEDTGTLVLNCRIGALALAIRAIIKKVTPNIQLHDVAGEYLVDFL